MNTRTMFRIVCRPPGDDKWRFYNFRGAEQRTLARAESQAAKSAASHPGWEYKIQTRQVTTTPWADCQEADDDTPTPTHAPPERSPRPDPQGTQEAGRSRAGLVGGV